MKNKFLIVGIIISVLLGGVFLKNNLPGFNNNSALIEGKNITQGDIGITAEPDSEVKAAVINIIEKRQMDIYRSAPYDLMEQIVGHTEVKSGFGKGFFVSEDGYILTAKHIVDVPGAEYTVILNSTQEFPAEIIKLFSDRDVALLKINTNGVPLPYLELQEAYSGGDIIKTQLSLKPGDSGSPLYNDQGEVIGVNISTDLASEYTSFASQVSREILEKYFEN